MKLQLSHLSRPFLFAILNFWWFLFGEGRQKTALSVTAQNEITTYFLVKNIRAKIQCHTDGYRVWTIV